MTNTAGLESLLHAAVQEAIMQLAEVGVYSFTIKLHVGVSSGRVAAYHTDITGSFLEYDTVSGTDIPDAVEEAIRRKYRRDHVRAARLAALSEPGGE